jgi:rhamnosyl/mannosyltransferase
VTVVATTSEVERLFVGPVNIVSHKPGRWFTGKRSFESLVDQISTKPRVIHSLASDGAHLSAKLADHYKADLVLQVAAFHDLRVYRALKSEAVAAMPAFTEPLADRMTAEFQDKGWPIEVIRPGTHALKAPTCFTDPDNIPTLLVDCPLVSGVGLNDVLEAAARLTQEQTEYMLFILGAGPKESVYRRRAAELQIGPHVTFAGQVREWTKVLEGADIFIQVRPSSAFQISSLGAMAAGMAVIGCPHGVEDYFHDDQTVLLASPVNADGFYRCLRRLLDDRGFARTLAAGAQEYVRTNHPPSAMASAYAKLYRELSLKRKTFPVKLQGSEG